VDPARACAAASALRELLARSPLGAGARVLGPAALFRLRGRERQVLVVKAPARREAAQALGAAVQALASTRAHAGVNFSVDVDPQ
jgi:primosomal protein N'